MPTVPSKIKLLSILAKYCWKIDSLVRYLTWKLEVGSDILPMVVGKNENEPNGASNNLNFVFAFEHLQN